MVHKLILNIIKTPENVSNKDTKYIRIGALTWGTQSLQIQSPQKWAYPNLQHSNNLYNLLSQQSHCNKVNLMTDQQTKAQQQYK